MIRGILKEYSALLRCDGQGHLAEDAARHLVNLYQSGINDGDELRRLLFARRY